MQLIFYPPLAFSAKGMRTANEDYFFPQQPHESEKLFVLCDGMGGLALGEIASKMTAESVYHFIEQHPPPSTQLPALSYFNTAIAFAHRQLLEFLSAGQLSDKMGTTLALLYTHTQGVCLLHLGDSRIYHIRNGRILHKTRDHRFVQELVAQGLISEKEAQVHPWRNALSKALVAYRNHEEIHQHPSLFYVQDVQPEDYFFLCTDGVFEQMTDYLLIGILQKNTLAIQKIQEILDICHEGTYDNYSGFLLKVQEVL